MQIPAEVAQAVVDPKAYADGKRVEDAFTWLRANAPLAKLEVPGFNPFWAVTKLADIQAIERQCDLFLAGQRPPTIANAATEAHMLDQGTAVRTLVQMDNPDHLAFRRLTQNWFMPSNLKKLEASTRECAREFIDLMASKGGECDFASDIAFLYPLRIIMQILGIPREDEPMMLKLTQEIFGSQDPDLARKSETGDADVSRNLETIYAFIQYFEKITEDRRANPRDDLSSAIANGEVRGEPLGMIDTMGYYVITATAGHDTTSNATAGALWALAENPEQFAKVKADPSLIPGMVEEAIRWETPVKHFMRTAADDAEHNGQKIAKGDWLMMCYSSGNRDEDVFDDPFRFDVTRPMNKQIGFGYGPHVCLGQNLAKMEMRIFWEELLPRLESVELAGTPRRTEANFVCGPKSVPIRYKMH